jgi:hypothetical protein
MKKLITLVMLSSFTHFSNGQNVEALAVASNDSAVFNKSALIEERLTRQEQEVKILKKDNALLKKEVNQLKSALNIDRTNRIIVNRRGSKQITTE